MINPEIRIAEGEIAVFFIKFYCSHLDADGLVVRYSLIQSAMEKMAKSYSKVNIPYKRYIQIYEAFGTMMVDLNHFRKCRSFYYLGDADCK